MTISVAWIRDLGGTQELIFASDSRLSGGGNVDQCQKVFPLPREDCCISFSGCTTIAYPFINQLQNSIFEYKKIMDRIVDINKFKGRVLWLLNKFISSHEDVIDSDFERDLLATHFIFGGWSWKNAKFYLWTISYDKDKKKYVSYIALKSGPLGLPSSNPVEFAMIGDYREDYHTLLRSLVKTKVALCKNHGIKLDFDYEPLACLATMLRDDEFVDRRRGRSGAIGGAPQVCKVYPFLRTMSYAVEWNIGEKFVYSIKGRIIPDFENFTFPGIDPFTGAVKAAVKARPDDFVPFSDRYQGKGESSWSEADS